MNDPIGMIIDQHERGYQAHKNDKGNYYKGVLIGTNWGISAPVLAEWLGRDITVNDMKNLSRETARDIYETNYLTGPRIHTLPEPPQVLILDMAINHGPRPAIRIMQEVINMAGFGPVSVDGVIGPQTRKGAETAQARMGNYFQNAIVDQRIAFYRTIVANSPSQSVFLNGWINRANSFRLPV